MRYTKRTRTTLFRRVLLKWYNTQRALNNYRYSDDRITRKDVNEKLRKQRDELMREWEELK